jgi:iron complex transport system substrate-binding protein
MRHHRARAALCLVVLALTAAACGGSGSTGAGTTTTAASGSSTSAGASDGPRTITNQWGTATLDAVPTKIVSLDPQFTDALLALGVKPAAYLTSDLYVAGGIFPWETDQLDGVPQIQFDGTTFDVQDVYNQHPDLIVGTYAIESKDRYDDLAEIATTIGAPDPKRETQTWQDMVTLAGTVLDRQQDAADLITKTEADIAKRAAALPGLKGKTYTFVNYVPGDALYVVADPDDGAAELFDAFGLSINPAALKAADGATGRAKFSLEQVDLLDSDVILMLANGGKPSDLIGFDSLRAATSGAVVQLDFDAATALNTPSVLSVPWVLDQIEPALQKVGS